MALHIAHRQGFLTWLLNKPRLAVFARPLVNTKPPPPDTQLIFPVFSFSLELGKKTLVFYFLLFRFMSSKRCSPAFPTNSQSLTRKVASSAKHKRSNNRQLQKVKKKQGSWWDPLLQAPHIHTNTNMLLCLVRISVVKCWSNGVVIMALT